ncbi:FecR family protein [Deinococcus depolymerans]|uniref:FecR family protein n=1 Tax=Deinococcus depolymerans TaxID=392408 RepID=A0ABP3MC93_9DEIO
MKVTAPAAVPKLHSNLRVVPLTALLLLGGAAFALAAGSAPTLSAVQGSVETLGEAGTWAAQPAGAAVTTSLRTGTGRAVLTTGNGQVVMGSASQLRRLRDEADLTQGRFFLRGPVAVHVAGNHVVMDSPGQIRVDLDGRVTRRVAVLTGQARVDLGGRLITVRAAQQLNLGSGQLSAFRETDPWYASQFRGLGSANVEATRGMVHIEQGGRTRVADVGETLDPGSRLNTDAGAWAEVGFTGGGYLRLNEQSELSVLAVERTERGREVLLKLSRGTAWNVVQKGQGGYRLDTPVVSTAVRGTVFRVDASGTVKVFEGQVALPGNADQTVSAGQQRAESGALGTLTPDALDRFNQSLDAERARPLTLALPRGARSMQDLTLSARSLPDATVTASVAGRSVTLSGAGGAFRLERLEDSLPEGRYEAQVTARRLGQTVTGRAPVVIDRTAPTVTFRATRSGRILHLTGDVQDSGSLISGTHVQLSVTLGGATYRRLVRPGPAALDWTLPLARPDATGHLTLKDEAGNERHVEIP